MQNLLAAVWSKYFWDALAALVFLFFLLRCGKKGFITCFFGLVSTVVALIVAFSLAKTVLNATGGLFGFEEVFEGKFIQFFSKMKGFNVDISDVGVEAALKDLDVSALIGRLALRAAGKAETLAAGTTIGILLGQSTARLAATLLAGALLFIAVKLLMRFVRGFCNGIAEKFTIVRGVNALLGSLYGFLYALFLLSALLAVLAVLPAQGISNTLEKTLFAGWLYEHNPLVFLLSYLL